MKEFVLLRAKTYSYLIDDGSEDKKARGTKQCITKKKLKYKDYKNCLEATQLKSKINYLKKKWTWCNILRKDHKEFIKTIN